MFRAYQISSADKPTEEELTALRKALPMVLDSDRWHPQLQRLERRQRFR